MSTANDPNYSRLKKECAYLTIILTTSLGTDYRGVNVIVWNYLQNIYGGGPEFVRGKALAKELEIALISALLPVPPFNVNVNFVFCVFLLEL